MTGTSTKCDCHQHFLLDPRADAERLRVNIFGPRQPLFALVTELVNHRHIETLEMLYSGQTALHAALNDTPELWGHQAFARQFGAPFVPRELAPSYAVRALAGLGLVLAQDQPDETPVRAALAWYQEARSSLDSGSCRWSPSQLAADDLRLAQRLELLAEVAGPTRNTWAALTAALTMYCLEHPSGRALPGRHRTGGVRHSPGPSIGLLFDRGTAGQLAKLTAIRLPGMPSGLIPDPERMSLFTADESFQSAFGRAWSQAGQGKIHGTVLWSAETREGPCKYATGESAGAAFAVILDEIRRLQRRLAPLIVIRRLTRSTAITGKIDAKGYLQSVAGYENKLNAVRELSKVVVPAADVSEASRSAAKDLEIAPATRWKDAARTARRQSKVVILRLFLAAAVVLALVGGGIAKWQNHDRVVQQQINLSEMLARSSDSTVSVNLRRADLYALASWQASHTEQARSSLLSREADPYLGTFAEPPGYIVQSLAISPNSQLLAVGGQPDQLNARSSVVQLWDIATRKQVAAFTTPNPVHAVAFSPGGTTLAAAPATSSGNLETWSVTTHRELPDPIAETGVTTSIAYSPNGRLLAVGRLFSAYSDGQLLPVADLPAAIDLWDLATRHLVRRLTFLTGPIWSLDFSPDGRLLASGDNDKTVRLWDGASGQQQAVLVGPDAAVQYVRFSTGGRSLAAAAQDGTIRVWDATASSAELNILAETGAAVFGTAPAFAFSPAGRYLYAAFNARVVSHVDLVDGNVAGDPLDLQQPVTHMAFSPDGRTLVVGGPNGSLAALNTGGNTFYDPDREPLTAAAVDRWGRLAATGSANGTIQLWNVSDPVGAVTLPAGGDVTSAAFSPDGWHLAVGNASCQAVIWDFQGAKRLVDLNNARRVADLAAPGTSGGKRLFYVAFSPDGKTLATYCADNTPSSPAVLTLWDTRTFKRLAEYIPPGTSFAGGMAYNPETHTIALDTGTGKVLFWDTGLRRITGWISVGQGTHDALAFNPDGRLLAVTGADGTVQLWNVSSRVEVAVTSQNTSAFHNLTFSPDGSTMAGTSQDSTIRIWQVPSLQLIETMSPPTSALATDAAPATYNGLAYSPDGQTLVTASSDSTAQVWDLNTGDEVRNLCNALGGPKLASQWRQLAPSPGPDPCPPG